MSNDLKNILGGNAQAIDPQGNNIIKIVLPLAHIPLIYCLKRDAVTEILSPAGLTRLVINEGYSEDGKSKVCDMAVWGPVCIIGGGKNGLPEPPWWNRRGDISEER